MYLSEIQMAKITNLGNLKQTPWALVYNTGKDDEVELITSAIFSGWGCRNTDARLFETKLLANVEILYINHKLGTDYFVNLRSINLFEFLNDRRSKMPANKVAPENKNVLFSRIDNGRLFSYKERAYIKENSFGVDLDNGKRHRFGSNVRVISESGSINLD